MLKTKRILTMTLSLLCGVLVIFIPNWSEELRAQGYYHITNTSIITNDAVYYTEDSIETGGQAFQALLIETREYNEINAGLLQSIDLEIEIYAADGRVLLATEEIDSMIYSFGSYGFSLPGDIDIDKTLMPISDQTGDGVPELRLSISVVAPVILYGYIVEETILLDGITGQSLQSSFGFYRPMVNIELSQGATHLKRNGDLRFSYHLATENSNSTPIKIYLSTLLTLPDGSVEAQSKRFVQLGAYQTKGKKKRIIIPSWYPSGLYQLSVSYRSEDGVVTERISFNKE